MIARLCPPCTIGGLLVAVCATTLAGEPVGIVNGTRVSASTYPWYVTVYSNGFQCGGSVIHARWILTASHCFDPGQSASTVSIVAGRDLLSQSGSGQIINAKRYLQHPNYDANTTDNDIALIELESDVSSQPVKLIPPAFSLPNGTMTRAVGRGSLASPGLYLAEKLNLVSDCDANINRCFSEALTHGKTTTDVVTIMLQANGLSDPTLGIGYKELIARLKAAGGDPGSSQPSVSTLVSKLSAVGVSTRDIGNTILDAAGLTDEIREVDLPIVDNNQCANSTQLGITDNMLCAGYTSTPKDTCQGDSGGPLVTQNSQRSDWFQLGIVSFGAACATNYGVYTRVSRYLDWIGDYVPHFNQDRVFTWGELAAAPQALQATGTERSSAQFSPYWARIYSTSGWALGVNIENQHLFVFDGKQLSDLGELTSWLRQAKAAGY